MNLHSPDTANGGAPAGGGPTGNAERPGGLLRGRRPGGRPRRRLGHGPLGGDRARQPRGQRPQYTPLQGKGLRSSFFSRQCDSGFMNLSLLFSGERIRSPRRRLLPHRERRRRPNAPCDQVLPALHRRLQRKEGGRRQRISSNYLSIFIAYNKLEIDLVPRG